MMPTAKQGVGVQSIVMTLEFSSVVLPALSLYHPVDLEQWL